MKVLTAILLLAFSAAFVGNAFADDGLRVPGLGNFGIAPAPSNLIEGQTRSLKRVKPLESVLATIKRRLPGRALGARLVEWQGREAYAIRWMGENGVVRDITADAVSGDILDER